MVPPPPASVIGGQEGEHVDNLVHTPAGTHDDEAGPSTVHHLDGEERQEVVNAEALDAMPQTVHSEQQSSTFQPVLAVERGELVDERPPLDEGPTIEVHHEGVRSNEYAELEAGEIPQVPQVHQDATEVNEDNVGGEASRVGSPEAGASARISSPNFASTDEKMVYVAPDTGELVILPKPSASGSSSKVGVPGWKPRSPREFLHFVYTKGPNIGQKLDLVSGQNKLREDGYKQQAALGIVKLVPMFRKIKAVPQDAAPDNYEIQSTLGDIPINEFGSNET